MFRICLVINSEYKKFKISVKTNRDLFFHYEAKCACLSFSKEQTFILEIIVFTWFPGYFSMKQVEIKVLTNSG